MPGGALEGQARMSDEKIAPLVAATYRSLLASERDPGSRRIIINLIREVETSLERQARPVLPPSGEAVH